MCTRMGKRSLSIAKETLEAFVDNIEQHHEDAKELKNRVQSAYSFEKISQHYDKFFKRWK